MIKKINVLAICLLAISTQAQTIWDAVPITFEKENNVDWTLEENQDRITDNVWITRANSRSIFNIVLEEEHDNDFFESPFDTEWAFGTTAEIDDLVFNFFDVAIMSFPPDMIDEDMVVHLITDDIYIDIKFTFWQEGNGNGQGGGGGFAYTRASQPTLSIDDENVQEISLFPNPVSSFLSIKGINESTSYTITSITGQLLKEGVTVSDHPLDVSQLASGIYVLTLEGHTKYKFIKQ